MCIRFGSAQILKEFHRNMKGEYRAFASLYGRDKNGKIKEWSIRVDDCGDQSVITCSYGHKDGKKVESKVFITKGKNSGKRNATTHFTQAIAEAESKWRKKTETDLYTTQECQHANSGLQNKDQQVFLPMLAQEYKRNVRKVKFPCYIQPKLDGYRMIYNASTRECYSRTGKAYSILKQTEMKRGLDNGISGDICLDGELYVHDSAFHFENYGVLRKTKGLTQHDLHNLAQIRYFVYDVMLPDNWQQPYRERRVILERLIKDMQGHAIQVVDTYLCNSFDDIHRLHERFVEQGYEGSIVRNAEGPYVCKHRSYDLLKLKDFQDAEYTIVSYTGEKDTRTNDDLIVWVCTTSDGKTFNVQSKGTREERMELYKEGQRFIGKQLSVQYFGLTADGIPRFPKTLRAGKASIREE